MAKKARFKVAAHGSRRETASGGQRSSGRRRDQGSEPGATKLLRTAEVLERTGITHQILYRYVTMGLVEPSVVTETGVRLFRPEAIAMIRLIQSFNQTGYSLQHLKETFFRDEKVRRLLTRGGT